jgi:hypothetical protein
MLGIGTPKIRVDRFLRFAFGFRLVFFAFRFLAMRQPPWLHFSQRRIQPTDKNG